MFLLLECGVERIEDMTSQVDSGSPPAYRSKTLTALLAMLTGWAGLHRLYLRSGWWWVRLMIALPAMGWALRAEPWFRHPGFFIFSLIVVIGLGEAVMTALTPDARWDQRHNAAAGRATSTRWGPILIAIGSFILAALLGMTVMAIALEGFFMSRRV
jgi:hypothetical protein